jgi:hypothetical protein
MKRMLIGPLAATLSTLGLLAAPAVAHADCAQWGFAGQVDIVEAGTGWGVTFFSNGTEAIGGATASNGGDSKSGQVSGGMYGKKFSVSVHYDNGQTQNYVGRVGDDGVANGVTRNGVTNESGQPFTAQLACAK